jgi:ATP phosphoribosyltransferase
MLLPGSLHAPRARGDGAPLGGGEAAGSGQPPLSRDRTENGRLDGDGDASGSLASSRGGRLPTGARPAEAQDEERTDRLTIAVPAKGRLREPAIALLEDAGLGPEAPGERALAFPCRNAPVDVLLVRAADVPEYVQDGVVDCGITGADLVYERAVQVDELLRLGFGACTLEAAIPQESPAQRLDDLEGLRIATVYPRLARDLLAKHDIHVELVEVTGSVEVAPRLGLADAIVDLVSSGSTLRTNGLRSLGALFSSEAVLVGPVGADGHARQLAAILRSVVEARDARYLMLNAPEDSLAAICELVPGSRSPSVLPLAEPGMVAVHALVPAKDVWRLLPRLEAAGASSILLLPVERMLA